VRVGSLFSGAGLGDLGWLMAGLEIAWQVEIEDYCQKILELRFPESKKYHDIKTFKGKKGSVDIVAGGPPCQPFSVAGNQRGTEDDRNLWLEMFRVIKEIGSTWVVVENVSGIIPIYLDTILNDLESEGYACRTFVFPAHSLGASHRRERIWVVGYAEHSRDRFGLRTDRNGETKTKEGEGVEGSKSGKASKNVANAGRKWWQTEPSICRVVNGCPSRVDRLKALGNGQVVACTAFIGQQIMELERIT